MTKTIAVNEVRKFILSALKSVGGIEAHSQDLADLLVAADSRGHYSHGLNRLKMYCDDYARGTTDRHSEPTIETETSATALVNGNNSTGPTVGKFCMNLAISKCRDTGVGVVTAKGSNHYGIAGYYGLMAKDAGYIGISMTNTSPLVVPTRSKECTLGTNPIAVVAPGQDEDYFALDMATSTVALGKIEVARRKGESLPTGWGCDSHGVESQDPGPILEGGGLFPLGGNEMSGGYKGYGLAMMVELFCGILSGATWGPHIRSWNETETFSIANLGQFFLALDPAVFGSGFSGRLQQMIDEHRALAPISGEDAVLIAGDPERESERTCRELGGIPYHEAIVRDMVVLAEKMGVEPMKTLQ